MSLAQKVEAKKREGKRRMALKNPPTQHVKFSFDYILYNNSTGLYLYFRDQAA